MAKLKVKTITGAKKRKFDNELEELINSVEDASIQYRTSTSASGTCIHSALVVYIEKAEIDESLRQAIGTAAPTGLDG